jgi:hypothetical protein
MKILVKTLLATVILLLAALPLCLGFALDYAFKQAVNSLGLSDTHFERGYLSSRAQITLKPLLEGTPQPLSLDIQLQHGPLLLAPSLQLGVLGFTAEVKSTAATPQLNVANINEPIYRLQGLIDLKGGGTFTDAYTAASLVLNNGQIQWSRGEGAGQLNLNLKRLTYEGRLSQLSWQAPNTLLNLGVPVISKEITLTPAGLNWLSRITFKALNAQWNAETFWLKNGALGLSRAPVPDAHTEHLQLSLVAEDFKTPSLQLTVLDANFALNHLPTAWLQDLLTLNTIPLDEASYSQQAYALTQKHLINSQAEFMVDRLGALQAGKAFWFSGRADLAAAAALPQHTWQDPLSLLPQLAGAGEIHLEKGLLTEWVSSYIAAQNPGSAAQTLPPAQIELFAQAFVGQGMLSDEGAMYACKVVFKPGEVMLNGKPLALPF